MHFVYRYSINVLLTLIVKNKIRRYFFIIYNKAADQSSLCILCSCCTWFNAIFCSLITLESWLYQVHKEGVKQMNKDQGSFEIMNQRAINAERARDDANLLVESLQHKLKMEEVKWVKWSDF